MACPREPKNASVLCGAPSLTKGRRDVSRNISKVSVSDLRKCLADVLNQVRYAEETVIIFNNGKPFAAIVPLADAEMLISSKDDVEKFVNGK